MERHVELTQLDEAMPDVVDRRADIMLGVQQHSHRAASMEVLIIQAKFFYV